MDIIRLPERALGVTEGEVDAVAFLDQMVEIFGFPRNRLFQQPEEVFARWPLIVVSELDVVPPAGGGVLHDKAEIPILLLTTRSWDRGRGKNG